MCGRFVRTSPADVIREEFGVTSMAELDTGPRYNVCPGEPVAAISIVEGCTPLQRSKSASDR